MYHIQFVNAYIQHQFVNADIQHWQTYLSVTINIAINKISKRNVAEAIKPHKGSSMFLIMNKYFALVISKFIFR